jgi:hypothetical protein
MPRLLPLTAALFIALAFGSAQAQQAKPAAEHSRKLLDTNRARVSEITLQPGAKIDLPHYPQRFAYLLTDARLLFSRSGHTPYEMSFKAGEATLLPTEATDVQNGSPGPVRAVIVELKDAGRTVAHPKTRSKGRGRKSIVVNVKPKGH